MSIEGIWVIGATLFGIVFGALMARSQVKPKCHECQQWRAEVGAKQIELYRLRRGNKS